MSALFAELLNAGCKSNNTTAHITTPIALMF